MLVLRGSRLLIFPKLGPNYYRMYKLNVYQPGYKNNTTRITLQMYYIKSSDTRPLHIETVQYHYITINFSNLNNEQIVPVM